MTSQREAVGRSPVRVLVYVPGVGPGAGTFYDLARSLAGRRKFDPVVVTHSDEVGDYCQSDGIEYHTEPDPLRWRRSLPLRAIRKVGLSNVPIDYYSLRRSRRVARRVLTAVDPDVQLLPSDSSFSPLLYMSRSSVPAVVPQITLDMTSVETFLEFVRLKERNRYESLIDHVLKPSIRRLDQGGLPVLGDSTVIPWNDPSKYLAARIAGVDFGVYTKAGTSDATFAINGPKYEDIYRSCGVSRDKLVTTGSPEHDTIVARRAAYSGESDDEFDSTYSFSSEDPVVSFFLQSHDRDYFPGDYHETVRTVVETLVERGCYTVVKTHPSQSRSDFEYLLGEGVRLIDDDEVGFTENTTVNVDLVLQSDLVVLQGSTIGYMAMATETPLLTFDFEGIPTADYFRTTGGSRHATEWDEFEHYLDELLQAGGTVPELADEQRCVAESHMMLDGDATERIATLLAERATHG